MAKLQVFENPDGQGFLLDVQSDLIEVLGTRVVVPLLPAGAIPPAIPRLHPQIDIGGELYVMATQLISAVPTEILAKPMPHQSIDQDQVTAALDMLFQGF
ncbi:CcdB family protein [Mesorhizobium sp. CAU 1741]|uniref:CcdB family protein n=1 Tax=Mesorhizobium sp. CAU 1741 TaxID=3140366 RepID=UPI00325C30A9